MFYIYILKSLRDLRTYVGHTEDIAVRLRQHNLGKVNATHSRRPFELIYTERCINMAEAKRREKYWKSGGGRRKLKNYFTNGFPPIQF